MHWHQWRSQPKFLGPKRLILGEKKYFFGTPLLKTQNDMLKIWGMAPGVPLATPMTGINQLFIEWLARTL